MNTSSAHVVVEAARPEDAVSIVDIQRRTWYATYPNKQFGITVADLREQLEGADGELVAKRVERWRQWIETGSDMRAIYMARLNGKTVGYATPAIVVGQRQVAALYILPEAQGYGLGGKLLKKTIAWHRQQAPDEPIFLHVVSYNHHAIGFYEHHGFEETGNVIADDIAKLPSGAVMPETEMCLK